MFTKLGRDEVLMARHMHKDVLAIFAQGRIQGEEKKVTGEVVLFLKKTSSSDRKATATNRIHSNDLPLNLAYNRSAQCTQVSDQCPLGL